VAAEPAAVVAAERPTPEVLVGTETFTQARIERIIALVVGGGCAVLGTQSFLNALGSTQEGPHWRLALLLLAFVPLAAMIIAFFAGVLVRVAAGIFAAVFPVVLLVWPLATAGRVEQAAAEPWTWYLINVATVAAVLSFPLLLQITWGVAVPVLYGVVRIVQIGFERPGAALVGLDVVFAMILAAVLIALAWMLRSVAIDIDRTRAEALTSYAAAAAADAAEQERIAVAALMHDSVLAALIAAERAETPRESTLAVSMAREALTRLANADRDAEEGSDDPVAAEGVAAAVVRAAADLGVALDVACELVADGPRIPGRVARALVLAATQAIANAVQHAGAAGLRAEVGGSAGGIAIRIIDTGPGFDPARVPEDRLGIRASIVARVAAVAGRARVTSTGEGTVVELTWEPPR